MNPFFQGYQYNAMWWRLCGNIAQSNLRVFQKLSEVGARQVRHAAVPMVAFGVYAANSAKPVNSGSTTSSALARARQNAGRIDVGSQRIVAPRPAPSREHVVKADRSKSEPENTQTTAV
ncbi:hypothetical protein [Primorskyibacter sedentarius]|uniref:hypothetical protein n=1 Tax=Primorskyibacter sedentarius TaxID=745311 RepID=UPI003EBE66D5